MKNAIRCGPMPLTSGFRFLDCRYACADDAHGTAIMLTAEKHGITPEQQIQQMQAEHERDSTDFLIGFDNFYTTHSEENRHFSEQIYTRLRDNGHIARHEITQAFDPEKQLFPSDRYIKGTCPKCKTPDQYGDNCEACAWRMGNSSIVSES